MTSFYELSRVSFVKKISFTKFTNPNTRKFHSLEAMAHESSQRRRKSEEIQSESDESLESPSLLYPKQFVSVAAPK